MASIITVDYEKWYNIKSILKAVEQAYSADEILANLSTLFKYAHSAQVLYTSLHKFLKVQNDFPHDTFVYIMNYIAKIALKFEHIIRPDDVAVIGQGQSKSHTLTREQVAAIVSHSFLCLHPEKHRSPKLPQVNFTRVFEVMRETEIEKIKCVLNYFDHLMRQNDLSALREVITFQRTCLRPEHLLQWEILKHSEKKLCPLKINKTSRIDDTCCEYAKVDFANMYLGGGILNTGCLQEEIIFTTCPELICGMFFMEAMTPYEAIIISGYKMYSKYKDYGREFRYDGPATSNANNTLVAIDAMDFRNKNSQDQYTQQAVMREINKAFAGFSKLVHFHGSTRMSSNSRQVVQFSVSCNHPEVQYNAIATGNWGCGAFRGDVQLKSLIQWIAATEAGCSEVLYCTLNFPPLKEFSKINARLEESTVGQLVAYIDEILNARKLPIFKAILKKSKKIKTSDATSSCCFGNSNSHRKVVNTNK